MRLFRRRNLIIFVVLAIAVVIGPYVYSRVASGGRQVRLYSSVAKEKIKPKKQLRVVAYNIAHGRGPDDTNWQGSNTEKLDRVEKIGDFIRSLDADIVILNEVDFNCTWSGSINQAEAIASRAGFDHRVEQRNLDFGFVYGCWQFGNAILSKYPILDADVIQYPALKSWERTLAGCKAGVICTIRISEDQNIQVVGVHLEHRDEGVRVESAKSIVKLAEGTGSALIAAGDFNSTPTGYPGSTSSNDEENAMDIFSSCDRFRFPVAKIPMSDMFSFSVRDPKRVIDWVLVPRKWSYTKYKTIASDLSDHLPIMATIELN